MPRAQVSPTIELEYETFGDLTHPTVLTVAGWGAQLITFHHEFCERLAQRGYSVIRFDNRDVGLSTKIEDGSSYTLEDMGADAVGLLDVLGIDRVHVMGQSMGGMIGQTIAINHSERVLTLTSIYSTTGAPGVGGATQEVVASWTKPSGTTREEIVASGIESSRLIWGDTPEFPFDVEHARWRSEVHYDRCHYPVGRLRHALAMRASGDRTPALRRLRVPTLVIHGDNDTLINISGGEATAAAIPGAEFVVIKGMGHVIARHAWDRIIDAFANLVQREAARA